MQDTQVSTTASPVEGNLPKPPVTLAQIIGLDGKMYTRSAVLRISGLSANQFEKILTEHLIQGMTVGDLKYNRFTVVDLFVACLFKELLEVRLDKTYDKKYKSHRRVYSIDRGVTQLRAVFTDLKESWPQAAVPGLFLQYISLRHEVDKPGGFFFAGLPLRLGKGVGVKPRLATIALGLIVLKIWKEAGLAKE